MKNAVFIIVLLFLTTSPASANIVINEIYPAPAENEEEWVELYNNSDQPVDLTGYSVTDELDKKLILQDMNVSSHGYVLATSNKILNNSGDTVKIKKDDQLIDEYTYGSHGSNYSSARCPDGSGEFQKVTTQTKALSNQPVCDTLTPTLIPQPTPTTHPSDQPGNDYNNIYLSEAYVYPASEESEWVELYNDNDFEAKLTNWYLDDLKDAGSAPKKFTVTIPAKSYAVVELSSYLNNSGDSVRLLNAEKEEKDSFSYSQAKKSLSFGKNPGGSACLQNPTRAASNSD
ncbi:MAG: lamin tail domain-containing protein, partial [Candidatus Paceibacterota bacterium]